MISVFAARRRAEEFAAAVDGDARGVGARNSELDRLAGVVSTLRAHEPDAPRADFVSDLRARLMTEAESVLTPENAALALKVRGPGPRERRLAAVASAVVLIGGTAGVATASQNALPGEALYPIKQGIEQAEAALSMSQAGRGHDLLQQADGRLTEVEGLIGKDSLQSMPQVPGTLDKYSSQATEGSGLLLESFEQNRDPEAVVQVRTFAADGIASLERIAWTAPPDARDELAAAAVTLRNIDRQAAAACSTCTPNMAELKIPRLISAQDEAERALGAATSALPDNSHPVVVPPGSIAASQQGTSKDGQSVQDDPTSGSTDSDGLPSTGDLDSDLSSPSPSLGDQLSDGTQDTVKTTKKTVKDVTDGLNGAVETLLPDSLLP